MTLMAGGTLLAPVGAQEAPQTPTAQPVICFDHDPQVAGQCTGSNPPNYLQGESITIDIEGLVGAGVDVSVRCARGCPNGDPSASKTYWARFDGAPLVFPRDFTRAGPNNDGGNAPGDQAPRYNSTWTVTAAFPNAPISRDFWVWTYDAFRSANLTVRPGEQHYIRSTGFTPAGEVSYRWERRDPTSGRFELVTSRPARASFTGPSSGWYEDYFRFPPSEARNILACADRQNCYRIVLGGAGKQTETVPVQVGVADVKRNIDTTPRTQTTPRDDIPLQRTHFARFIIDLHYPGGLERHGPKLLPADVAVSPTLGVPALRAAVEKVYNGNGSVFQIDETFVLYEPSELVWKTNWTIPRNLTPEASTARYRIRLVEQRDLYGNRILEEILGNFTVSPALIQPRVTSTFREIERTEEAIIQLAVLYHNGDPFTPDEAAEEGNRSPLRGCFVRQPDPPPPPAPPAQPQVDQCGPNDPLIWGRYDPSSERWNFSVRFTRDYPNLDGHRFILVNGTVDDNNNQIHATASNFFTIVPARPNVDFSTVMRGREAEVFERGNRIFVTATITYHDGAPYNHNVRANPNSTEAQVLSGRLLRRGPAPTGAGYGPLAGEEVFNLTETDPSSGRWSGYLQLSDDDTNTPAGIWTFQFDVADNVTVPNINRTSFDREVVSSTIVLCPTFQPTARVATGTNIKFRFKLFYSECDTGREVPSDALVGKLTARVYRFDAGRQAVVGGPLSNILVPSFSKDATRDWGIEYDVPDSLFTGEYAILVTGADTFGNKLIPNARSRPFSTFTEIVERAVIAQPPPEVKRGESATVVFDAREGDTSTDPNKPAPRIQLERFDTTATHCATAVAERGCWVRERADVRVPDPSFEDHVGEFPVGIDTPVGVYRFSLQGRDATFHLITGLSGTFVVNPTQVTRAFVTTPPERILKGEPFTFYLEQMPGDKITERVVFLDGRAILMPSPQVNNEFGRANVTWAIPFEAPTGNYTIRVSGTDVNGNTILVLTPPIEALATTLEGRVLGQPARNVERGATARILFAIAYPDGGFYAAADTPRVFVRNASGPIANAIIRREGLSFAAEWRPTKDTPAGDYYFEVSPQPTGGTGNAYPPLRSNVFKIIPGRIVRPPVDQLGESLERLTGATFGVPFEKTDKFVTFDLVYYGPSTSTIVDTTTPLVEITRSPLPHTIDVDGGKYVARLVTDQESQTGTFKIVMSGEDGQGNRIVSESRPLAIRPTTIGIQFDRFPPQSAFGEGKTITISFVAKYAIGTLMDDSYGRPSVVALFNGRPITQRPDVTYVDGHWYMSWTAPDVLPDGEYQFSIGGSDIHGNPIATSGSTPYIISTDLGQSFAKTIPGPSPLLGLVVVALAAALLLKRRR